MNFRIPGRYHRGFSGCWSRAEGKEKALATNLLVLQTFTHCLGGFCSLYVLCEYLTACFIAEELKLKTACTMAAAEAEVICFNFQAHG